jgi:hypothetical protein
VSAAIGSPIQVYIGPPSNRRLVSATLLFVNSGTIYVRLPDSLGGNVVQRRINRDVPDGQL